MIISVFVMLADGLHGGWFVTISYVVSGWSKIIVDN